MQLLPQPKSITAAEGVFALGWQTEIVLENTVPSAFLHAQMLQAAIEEHAGLKLLIRRGVAREGDIALRFAPVVAENRYAIAINSTGATLEAGSAEALCNGVQTLCQLVRLHGLCLPAMRIEDWPDMENRAYYLDVSRGRVPTLETLKAYADLLCRYKVNQWQLYIEHTYLFRDLSEAWRDETPLTAEEIMELDAYCAARCIELVPSLSTFGHMYKILSTKTHSHLCELEDSEKIPFSFSYAGRHHTLNVSEGEALSFIITLIEEYRQLFTSTKFNICADETFDLGKGRSKALADEQGERALYVRHVKALCEHLVAQGVTPMFWGDIMWRFPEACNELPKETICLNWGYLPHQREDEMRCIAETGATQYACPGVCGWNRWVPLIYNSYCNITTMCGHAKKYAAVGMLNTDWGDYGHVNDPRLSVPGILYGAAFSWNAEMVPFEEINKAVSLIEYGDTSQSLVAAMAALSDHEVFNWEHAVNWIEAVGAPQDDERQAMFSDLDMAEAEAANRALGEAKAQLCAAARAMPAGRKDIVRVLCTIADGVELWNDIGVYVAANFYNQPLAAQGGEALAVRLENWLAAYQRLWREVSREGALPRITTVMTRYADLLRGRALPAN